ncbi:cytochrome P450 [Streptomyces sp. NPDC093252]|uniref:cytochrome P450 n=1 Tax=Streptomyces sp. NPDC093252 TaxID=3154980 RepID=UPI00341A446E
MRAAESSLHPPRVPGGFPLLGHTPHLMRNPLSFLRSLPAAGELVEVRLGPWPAYVVCSPRLTRQLLLDDRTFDKGGPLIDRAREALGDGVATCPHARHRRQRRLNQSAFHQARMPAYATRMTAHLDALTASWEAGRSVDVLTALEETAVRILIGTMFLGTPLPAAEQTRMVHDVLGISRGVFRRMFMPPALAKLPLLGNRGFEKARTHLRHTALRTIAHHRDTGRDYGDLLSTLVGAQDPGADAESARLSDEELADTIITYFFAGAETSAALAAWAVYFTARHPEVEKQVQEEADRVLGGAAATHDDLPRLETARRVITETLRVRPPGWIFTRVTARDTLLGPYRLPEGSTLLYSQYLAHHRDDDFPDPDRFDPDRWAGQGPGGTPPSGSFVPFALGARKCIGDTFATMEATLALATIASRWTLRPAPGMRLRTSPRGLVLRPDGLRMIPTPRARV